MTTNNQDNNTKTVTFNNCNTYGDEIEALVRKYAGEAIGTFVLEQAVTKVKEATRRIKASKDDIITEVLK